MKALTRGLRSKFGFSLPEALVMIIMAGYIMVPIFGTMTNSVSRLKALDLKKAMQNVAESKMNEKIHEGAFLGNSLGTVLTTVDFPNSTNPEFHFNVSFEVLSNISVAKDSGADVAMPKTLKAISVEVGLQETEPQIASVTLFSLFDEPPIPPDYLYVADPPNKAIFVINCRNHLKKDVYTTGADSPYFLAVHPNGEWLGIKCAGKILLMDIRPSSPSCGSTTAAFTQANILAGNTTEIIDNTGYRYGRGIVFRSDGKYLYFTERKAANGNYFLKALTMPALTALGSLPGPTFSVAAANEWDLLATNTSELTRGEDGYLYVGRDGSTDANQPLLRFNTHTHTLESLNPDWQANTTAKAYTRGICTSWDGNDVLVASKNAANNYFLGNILSHSPTHYFDSVVNPGLVDADGIHGLVVSRDNVWAFSPLQKNGNQPKLSAIRRSLDGTWASSTDYDTSAAINKITKSANIANWINLKPSPYGKEIVVDEQDNDIIRFVNTNNAVLSAAVWYSTWQVPAEYAAPKISDTAGRLAEYAWLGTTDGATNRIECLDINGGTIRGRRMDSKAITLGLSGSPDFIAVTPSSDKAYVAQKGYNIVKILDCFDDSLTSSIDLTAVGAFPNKAVWTLDRTLCMLASKTANATANASETTATATNGLRVYTSDSNGNIDTTCDLGYHLKGTDGWEVRDIVAMHRRNGCYALMAKSDLSRSRLLWVEKSRSGGMSGTEGTLEYKIMADWDSLNDGFPEGKPWKLALSADDTLLAISDPAGDGTNSIIRVYDLNNQHFPAQPGMIFANYDTDTGSFASAPVRASLNLKTEAMTKYMTTGFNPQNKYPGYIWQDVDPLFCHQNSAHFTGIWYTSGLNSIGLMEEYGARFFLDGTQYLTPTNNNNFPLTFGTDLGGESYGAWNISPADGSHEFQLDHFSGNWSMSNQIISWSTGAAGGAPSGPGVPWVPPAARTPTYPPLLTGGPTWQALRSEQIRAFRFRPQLLQKIVLDGSLRGGSDIPQVDDQPNYTVLLSDPDLDPLMAFGKDQGRCYLFLCDNTDNYLYGLDLFGTADFTRKSLYAADILNNQYNSNAEGSDMAVTPDGRRIMILGNHDMTGNNNGVAILDIDYDIPFANPTFRNGNFVAFDTGFVPKCLAIRQANSFNSNPASFSPVTLVSGTLPPAGISDNQNVALASGGIYMAGGSDGYGGAPITNLNLFDPITQTITAKASLSTAVRHAGLVSYDDSLLFLGGENSTGQSTCTVKAFPVSGSAWSNLKDLQKNTNATWSASSFAACQTPYGLVTMGGVTQSAETPYYNFDCTPLTTGNTPGIQITGTAVLGASYLDLGDDDGAYLDKKIPLCDQTSFKTSFELELNGRDGVVFCIQNQSSTAAGGGNSGMGYTGITPSVGVWIDNHDNGGFEEDDWIGIAINGAAPAMNEYGTASGLPELGDAEPGVVNSFWWVDYAGDTNTLKVYFSLSPTKPGLPTVTKVIDIPTIVGKEAWFGFTSGQNYSYIRIKSWKLELFAPDGKILSYTGTPPFSSDAPFSNTDAGFDAVNKYLLMSMAGNPSSKWLKLPINFDAASDFKCRFSWSGLSAVGGLTFTIQGGGPTVVGDSGANMGYSTLLTSLGVCLDGNPGAGNDKIYTCVNGNMITPVKTTDMGSSGYIDNGTQRWMWLDYTYSNKQLKIYNANSSIKPTTASDTVTFALGLASYLGNKVYLGFTADGDGTDWYIKDWEFSMGAISSIVLSDTKVYYPHVNTGTTAAEKGETLGLADLPLPGKDGAAVCHYSRKDRQWYLYYVGSASQTTGVPNDVLLYRYDFNTNTSSSTWNLTVNGDVGDTDDTERTGVAACSQGDEIFIFGGARAGAVKNNAIAYNPDSGKWRTLSTTGIPALFNMSAVPVGPFIYLMGGAASVGGTTDGTTAIYRYSP